MSILGASTFFSRSSSLGGCRNTTCLYVACSCLLLIYSAFGQKFHIPIICKVKVKVPRNRPESADGGRGIALLFLDLSARRGWWSAPHPSCFTPGKDPVPIVQEAVWAPGPVWTCAKVLAPTGIRSPDHPAHSQSLYQLS
jgi:hypothetical protein